MAQANNQPAKVTEIVAADGLLFGLCQSGSCTAFNRGKRSVEVFLCCIINSNYVAALCCIINSNYVAALKKARKLRLLTQTCSVCSQWQAPLQAERAAG